MIEFQEKWDPIVPGIHFVIGFSGKFFQRSENEKETEGDQYILGQFSYTLFLKINDLGPAFRVWSPNWVNAR